ncbi:hypothetical protein SAMN05421855_10474 [Ulvibacter litoralis]|uniref:Uncharacterized protein n=1 Tax=Ulvibacter litoralis TaxID=227084 RepID=A0A1G7HG38_9FLAO|nr:hypothetical protein SAMN05421855_10474 [Ulvibacter litoralis]
MNKLVQKRLNSIFGVQWLRTTELIHIKKYLQLELQVLKMLEMILKNYVVENNLISNQFNNSYFKAFNYVKKHYSIILINHL